MQATYSFFFLNMLAVKAVLQGFCFLQVQHLISENASKRFARYCSHHLCVGEAVFWGEMGWLEIQSLLNYKWNQTMVYYFPLPCYLCM